MGEFSFSDHHRPQHLVLTFMQIFPAHEKENKLNHNSRWNLKGIDFALHWRRADETGTSSVTPPTKLIQMRYLCGIDTKWLNHFNERVSLLNWNTLLEWNKCDYWMDQRRAGVSFQLLFKINFLPLRWLVIFNVSLSKEQYIWNIRIHHEREDWFLSLYLCRKYSHAVQTSQHN